MSIIGRLRSARAMAQSGLRFRLSDAAAAGILLGGATKSGAWVTPDTALRATAVYACVRVLAEDVAKLPLILYRRTGNGGKERATDHPLYRVLHDEPNHWQTSYEWREGLQGHLGLRGNSYSLITRYRDEVRELIPLPAHQVTPRIDRSLKVTYEVAGMGTYKQEEILHLRGLSSNGLTGLSPVGVAREAVGLALTTEQHAAKIFGNRAMPGGILEHPKVMSEQAAKNLKQSVEAATSGDNAYRLLLLEEGTKWVQAGLSNEDAQFIESRKYQVAEIARLYRMPLHKIQEMDKATFGNIEHQSIEYVIDTLLSWLVRWEQRLNRSLLKPEERGVYFFEFLPDMLLRGTTKERYEAHRMAILDGWKTRNEVRAMENLNPAEGLDEFLEPLNMVRASERAAS